MIVALTLAAAGAAFTPPMGRPGAFIGPADFMSGRLQRASSGGLRLRITIDEGGRPVACAVDIPSVTKDLDGYVCTLARRRLRFKPALDGDGLPVWAIVRIGASWTTDKAVAVPYDVAMKVARLPGGELTATVGFAHLVDEQGRSSGCRAVDEKAGGALAAAACRALPGPFEPIRDAAGNARAGVQVFGARFVADG